MEKEKIAIGKTWTEIEISFKNRVRMLFHKKWKFVFENDLA